jgi:DNA mismatch repair protein MutS
MTVIPSPLTGAAATPMIAQYLEIKASHPDCLLFYRMGDFYELFFSDAEIASATLSIVLTKRGKHVGADIPMCGVPIDRADDYLQRLITAGHRVAVCEQVEDPAEAKKRGAKSVVRRAVVRLVTPGTLTEDQLLEPSRANTLMAVVRLTGADRQSTFGLAAVDISTGAFTVSEIGEAGLANEIVRLDPRELIISEAVLSETKVRTALAAGRGAITPIAAATADSSSAERRLCEFFGLATLAGLGPLSRAEIGAAASVVSYIERTQFGARPQLSTPARLGRGQILEIDAATRSNLELTRTLSGARDGSLLAAIDRTVTASGGRLLAERLSAPLTMSEAINQRLDGVDYFVADSSCRHDVRALLKRAPDLARSLQRLALDRGGPRDLAAIGGGLEVAEQIARRLRRDPSLPDDLNRVAEALQNADQTLAGAVAATLVDDLPLHRKDGGFVRLAADAELDELRILRDDSRRVIAGLQSHYAEKTQIRQLRIKHNHFLGYFLEVPQAAGETLLRPPFNAIFIHRQTMADAMRFATVELNEVEAKIASAQERSLVVELAIFERLRQHILARIAAIRLAADGLAAIDVASALGELAATHDWVRPSVTESLEYCVENARHPVVEAALKKRGTPFVANDCDLSPAGGELGKIALITGPNMAGKSTYLRQNALIVILAQMGSYVPAHRARLGIVDRLFSRVGAADDLARGQSTFMVEMVETAAILNQATRRSLVILDEIGRGTSTFDGLSIAWATVEHLHSANRARTLFATHFHELTQLAKTLPRLVNLTVRVTEWKEEPIFLHEVIAGAADRSYGIQVAKLAGLPRSVIKRARTILATLEAGERRASGQGLIDELPLFAARIEPLAAIVETATPEPDPISLAIAALTPDEMTPKQALEALYELKRLAAKAESRE